MHWVGRGREPTGLAAVRARYTPGWVCHYILGFGTRPTDSRWTDFKSDLEEIFAGLCAYCECLCRGEVDHFQPKSIFPRLVYDWANWLLACHDCNQAKLHKWPPGGYVDPCATSISGQPENFFDFDTLTGEIVPKASLSSTNRRAAQTMIDDLKLNEHHHLKKRLERVFWVEQVTMDSPSNPNPKLQDVRQWLALRTTQYSSIVRARLVGLGYPPTG